MASTSSPRRQWRSHIAAGELDLQLRSAAAAAAPAAAAPAAASAASRDADVPGRLGDPGDRRMSGAAAAAAAAAARARARLNGEGDSGTDGLVSLEGRFGGSPPGRFSFGLGSSLDRWRRTAIRIRPCPPPGEWSVHGPTATLPG